MYKYKYIIHDTDFTFCVVACTDSHLAGDVIESNWFDKKFVVHKYIDGNLDYTIEGEKYKYYEKTENS